MNDDNSSANKPKYQPSTTAPEDYGPRDYVHDFRSDEDVRKAAFELAHKIRELEIQLYWKRAAYFWTFISVTLAGYALVETKDFESQGVLSLLLACTGFIFASGWFLVNRGSKFWQENWENHVDNLEDRVVGPLYKVILSRPDRKKLIDLRSFEDFDNQLKYWITGPSLISVSKVNQIISLYVTLLWLVLIVNSLLPIKFDLGWDFIKIAILVLATVTFVAFCRYGGSHLEPMRQKVRKRDVDFVERSNGPTPSL